MGENQWRDAATWPPEGYLETAFYLHSRGQANSRRGDGRLDRSPPESEEAVDRFRADPADPTPAAPVTDKLPLHAATWAPVDQRSIEDREDCLVYTSEPLTEPLLFAGNARAELLVATDTPDADWVVRLIDVHPDGAAYNLTVGILRGRYRESLMQPQLMTPGEVTKLNVDLGPIAAQFTAGHRLRVDISGAYFPLFDRNPNTAEGIFGKTTAVATESIYHSAKHPSRIILPVLPRERSGKVR
jgi:uncharacterized protein